MNVKKSTLLLFTGLALASAQASAMSPKHETLIIDLIKSELSTDADKSDSRNHFVGKTPTGDSCKVQVDLQSTGEISIVASTTRSGVRFNYQHETTTLTAAFGWKRPASSVDPKGITFAHNSITVSISKSQPQRVGTLGFSPFQELSIKAEREPGGTLKTLVVREKWLNAFSYAIVDKEVRCQDLSQAL